MAWDLTSPAGFTRAWEAVRRWGALHGTERLTVGEPTPSGRKVNLQRSRIVHRKGRLKSGTNPYDYVLVDDTLSDIAGTDGSNAYELNGLTDLCASGATPFVLLADGATPAEKRFQYIEYGTTVDHGGDPLYCIYLAGCNGHTKGLTLTVKRHDNGTVVGTKTGTNYDDPLCVNLHDGDTYDVVGSGADYSTTTWTITPPAGVNLTGCAPSGSTYPPRYCFQLPLADPTKTCYCQCPDPKPRTLHLTDKYGTVDLTWGIAGLCALAGTTGSNWNGCHVGSEPLAKSISLESFGTGPGAQFCVTKCSDGPAGIIVAYCLTCSATPGKWTLIKGVSHAGCKDAYGIVREYLANAIRQTAGWPDCTKADLTCDDGITTALAICSADVDFGHCGDDIDLTFSLPNTPFQGSTLPTADTVTVTE